MTLPKNDAIFNDYTAAIHAAPRPQTVPHSPSIVIVNANTALACVLQTALSTQLPHVTQIYESWHTIFECYDALPRLNHDRVLWIACADDDNPEILDFIDVLYQTGQQAIIAIDTRTLQMPTMWLSYYKAGVSACLIGDTTTGVITGIEHLNQGRGLLNREGHVKQFHRYHHQDFTPLELELCEFLFARQLIVDMDDLLGYQFTNMESCLLDQLGVNTLDAILPDLAEIFWQEKHHGVAKTKLEATLKATPALSIAVVTTDHVFFHKLKARLLQSRKISEITMHHSARAVVTHTTQNNPAPDLIVLQMSHHKSHTELRRLFDPLKVLPATTKKLVMGTETNINTPAMAYFKAGSQGYIDQAASLSLWECAIDTIYRQGQQFWQLLQQPIAAYTITDSAKVLAREVGGIFSC